MSLYLLDPFNDSNLYKDNFFESPYKHFKNVFVQNGDEIHTIDCESLKKADALIVFNHNSKLINEYQKIKGGNKGTFLVLTEPETVLPGQYNEAVYSSYEKVITYREDLVDRYGFKKTCYPQGQEINKKTLGFNERKFLTLINANKYSYVHGELYTKRRELIKFFDEKRDDFDLYGFGWGEHAFLSKPVYATKVAIEALKRGKILRLCKDLIYESLKSYNCYKGTVENKYQTLEKYRFAVCIENESSWFTEKMFDAFSVGTVPIFEGPEEIYQHVPKECFIDLENFANFEELIKYLDGIGETEWNKFQENIYRYLDSASFQKLRPENILVKLAKEIIEL